MRRRAVSRQLAAELGVSPGDRAAAVHPRARRPRPGAPVPVAVARRPARSVRARPTCGRPWTASSAPSRAASASPFTATTTSTASPRRSSCAARSSCSAPTSSHFIPERLRDGYGLQPAALDRLHADGVRLVISVDCGIRGVEAALHAQALGLDLIITDHHEPDTELPEALRRDQSEAPRLQLSGQEPRGRRRGAEAGAGAVRASRAHAPGCRRS